MSDRVGDGQLQESESAEEKRRVMVTQMLRSPVFNPAGEQVGRLEDLIAKLADGGYPPIKGLKVRIAGRDVFVGSSSVEKLEPGDAVTV